ncbi:MAG: serine/threonine-protein kinase [Planctomycetota bacterium]|nr:serine/threonine-protein kinase [Planctomycetota bacterium]
MAPDPRSDCPDRVTLERMAREESVSEATRTHVDGCGSCRGTLDELREENDLLRSALFAESAAPPTAGPGGQVVPGYELQGELHRGGQGVVYRARQLATNRPVAIKMMLQGRLATSHQRLRFNREVELVAGLRHPGIVTLYESGATTDGNVYFAMEFVDGSTLDAWSRRPGHSVTDRVRLFAGICGAVRYAHARGVIHRDLKPGNILVDTEDQPHVLDFGIARMSAEHTDTEETVATLAGEFLGTLAYAAPEQLEGDAARIDVRTDVFALGVILYELLTGVRPFDAGNSLAQLIANRLDQVPDAPSRLTPELDRDLDVICLKALSPDPERRYASAAELEEDLRRHLNRQPILARADSTSYVLGRIIRRNKLLVGGVSALLALSVVSAISFAILFAYAETEKQTAQRTLQGFQDAIGIINPESGQGSRDMSVEEYIQSVEEHVEANLGTQPRIASALLTTLGLIELAFRNTDRSRELLERALALRGEAGPAALGESWHNLGRLHTVRRDFPEALLAYERSLDLRRTAHGSLHTDVAMTHQHLGSVRRRLGDFAGARAEFETAESIWLQLHGDRSEQLAGLINNRAWIMIDLAASAEGDEPLREAYLEEALAHLLDSSNLIRSLVSPNDYRVGLSERSIGKVLAGLGKNRQAVERFDESIRILSSRMGDEFDSVQEAKLLRARCRMDLGFEDPDLYEATCSEVESIARERERRGRRYGAPAPWLASARAWGLLSELNRQGGHEAEAVRAAAAEAAAVREAERLRTDVPAGTVSTG